MRESVFTRLENYKGNPLDEYVKILNLIKNEYCYEGKTIFGIFEYCFSSSQLLRSRHVDFESCLKTYLPEITRVTQLNEVNYGSPFKGDEEKTFDEFLSFCELLAHMKAVAEETYVNEIMQSDEFDINLWNQFSDMVRTSLKSIGYELEEIDEEKHKFEAVEINPEAEIVAEQAPKEVRTLIFEYLGAREDDKKNRERVLLDLITELLPTLKRYKQNDENAAIRLKKVSEYVQLMRHSAENREKEKNSWFYGNKGHYLNDLFNLCIFVQNYELTKKTIEKFQSLEVETTKENQSL